jgi:bifunctional DNA-binding transcriptional regulator/antitoxin component of YhaV-PrlF toxin-antitoxin module
MMITSSLLKGIARVDSDGKIEIPKNMLGAMDLKEKSIVELKIIRSGKTTKIMVSKPRSY